MGQGASLQTGLERGLMDTRIRYFITFDSDGQHSGDDVLAMVEVLRSEDVDVVLGSRFLDERSEVPPSKQVALLFARGLMNLTTGIHLTDAHNGLRAFNRRFAASLHIRESGMAHASEIVTHVARGGFTYRE
jgi:hypothetical protein